MSEQIIISFPKSSEAEKAKLAVKISDKLRETKEINDVEVLREREETQDPGTIVSIVLGAPAVVLAVKAMAAWAVRNNQTDLTIETKDRKVIFKNLKSENVADAVKALEKIVK